MWLVSGSNIFGQWSCQNSLLKTFQPQAPDLHNEKDLNVAKLIQIVQINWSYNLLQLNDKFFISGFYRGEEKQFTEIELPEPNINSEITLIGNDYNLFIVNKNKHCLWLVNIDNGEIIKKIEFSESYIETSSPKRKCLKNDIIKVICSNDNIVYLTSRGIVYCGALPSYVDTRHCEGKVCDIECGFEHYLLLTETGKVYSWGNGRRLQLGHDDIENLDTPTLIEALAGIKIVKVKAGGWHSFAVSEFGDLYVWGWNESGQLGIKENIKDKMTLELESQCLPTLVDFFDDNNEVVNANVKDIACGSRHSAIILDNNTLWTTGCNKYGQLGLDTDSHQKSQYFRKIMECSHDYSLICGPWSTVLITQ